MFVLVLAVVLCSSDARPNSEPVIEEHIVDGNGPSIPSIVLTTDDDTDAAVDKFMNVFLYYHYLKGIAYPLPGYDISLFTEADGDLQKIEDRIRELSENAGGIRHQIFKEMLDVGYLSPGLSEILSFRKDMKAKIQKKEYVEATKTLLKSARRAIEYAESIFELSNFGKNNDEHQIKQEILEDAEENISSERSAPENEQVLPQIVLSRAKRSSPTPSQQQPDSRFFFGSHGGGIYGGNRYPGYGGNRYPGYGYHGSGYNRPYIHNYNPYVNSPYNQQPGYYNHNFNLLG